MINTQSCNQFGLLAHCFQVCIEYRKNATFKYINSIFLHTFKRFKVLMGEYRKIYQSPLQFFLLLVFVCIELYLSQCLVSEMFKQTEVRVKCLVRVGETKNITFHTSDDKDKCSLSQEETMKIIFHTSRDKDQCEL